MFNQGGLSLEQAPPISVVLRFFVTGAVFGIAAGIAALLFGDRIYAVGSPQSLIMIHLLALGVMASFMLGALFQMLPVIAGVVLPDPIRKATVVHIAFVAGLLLLLAGFESGSGVRYTAAAVLLGGALLYALSLMLYHLFRLQNHSASSRGMRFALLGFLLTLLFALYMLAALAGWHAGADFAEIRSAHYSFALFGWVALLIVSISFQVVEMFYVTPPYPALFLRYFTGAIFLLLLLKTLLRFVTDTHIVDLLIALLFILYGAVTIHRLYRRKRPTSDATVWFWRLGMGMLILSMTLWSMLHFSGDPTLARAAYGAFLFFALSIVFAMVYKIVPFLTWFHLSNQGYMKAPLMHEIIHPQKAKIHFYIQIATILAYTLSLRTAQLLPLAALLLTLSFGWLLWQIGHAIYLYRNTQKHGEKIVW